MTVPLLGVVDTAVIGHLKEIYFLGAIAVGGIIFNFIFWGFGFLRMGTTGMAAQAYGEKDKTGMISILYRVELLGLLISLLIVALQQPLLEISFLLIDASEEVERYTRIYFAIRIYSAPATLALYGLNGWFLGMQNAKYPMIITIVLNLVNLGLNLFFVYGLDMNVDGVAWGSLIASYVALVVGFVLLWKEYRGFLVHIPKKILFEMQAIRKFFSVNRDIFIRTLCLIFSFSFFTAVSAAAGDTTLAVNTILLQFWTVAAYGIDGFAFSAESLVGRFIGEKNTLKLKEAVKYTLAWGIGMGFMASIIYLLFSNFLLTIFTDNQLVISEAKKVILWTVMAPTISSICYIWDGVYIGATSTVAMRNSMLFATVFVFIPAYYVGNEFIGDHALWLAMTLFMLSRGVVLFLLSGKHVYGDKSVQSL